jgi:hypothetical protein
MIYMIYTVKTQYDESQSRLTGFGAAAFFAFTFVEGGVKIPVLR